jgi:hypothetical protein
VNSPQHAVLHRCLQSFGVEILDGIDEAFEFGRSAVSSVAESYQIHSHGRENPERLEDNVEETALIQDGVLDAKLVCEVRPSLNLFIAVESAG